jgi:hypothetical protein
MEEKGGRAVDVGRGTAVLLLGSARAMQADLHLQPVSIFFWSSRLTRCHWQPTISLGKIIPDPLPLPMHMQASMSPTYSPQGNGCWSDLPCR